MFVYFQMSKTWMYSEFDVFIFYFLGLKIAETTSKHAFELRYSLK